MNWYRMKAIMGKDNRAVTASKMVMLPIVIVPVLLCVLVPAAILLLALRSDTVLSTGVQYVEKLVPLYPVPEALPGLTDRILIITRIAPLFTREAIINTL
jgi:hypothetical protein